MKTEIITNGIAEFVWRDLIASYNSETKELKFNQQEMYGADWENYPNDAVAFILWLENCLAHKNKSEIKDNNKLYSIHFY